MEVVKLLQDTALSFLFMSLVFIPMEKVFPAKPGQSIFRPRWFMDLGFFLGQYLFWGGLVLWLLSDFGYWFKDLVPLEVTSYFGSIPLWLQMIWIIVLSDFIIYWGHRLQHSVGFLWRFHKVHHSAEHMDWLAAHREHPLDSIFTIGLINLPAFALGFPLETLAGFIAFRGIWAIYIHSNVRLPLGPIRKIIGAPELHHWHHDKDRKAGNYANISPLMDIIFGTYTCPDHEPRAFGIDEPSPKSYFGQLVEPMLPGFLARKIWK